MYFYSNQLSISFDAQIYIIYSNSNICIIDFYLFFWCITSVHLISDILNFLQVLFIWDIFHFYQSCISIDIKYKYLKTVHESKHNKNNLQNKRGNYLRI